MKKIAGVLSALLCVLLFSSFSPSLDGRAVVADDGVMPQGIFAKTVGYLPGDSISVTNLLTKSTVDILVIGALDPSEGVAILLSPESASLLGLEKGGNNVVKITKRSGQLDEQVSGTAVIGGGTYENPGETGEIEDEFESENESENESESVLESVEETAEPETEVLSDETEIPEEEISSEEIVEKEEEISEEDEIPEESEEVLLPEEESVSGDEFDYSSGDSENDSDEDISERIEDDFVPEDEEAENPSEPEYENEKDDDESPLYESVSEDELLDVASAEPFEEDIYEIDEPEVTELSGTREDENEKEPLIEEPSSESVEAENLSELSELEETEEETSGTEKPERFFEEPELEELENEEDFSAPEQENEDENEESYEPIILVPSDMNPPERLYSSQESLKESENEGENAENDVKTEIPESSGMNALNDPEENRAASESSKNSWEDKVLESEASLEKSKWYIQIAVLADFSNISNLVEKYGEDYPLVLVPSSNGKGYRILVGPLSVDEYGTVLNRFRSYGFKDAFLRKIK